MPKLLQNLRPVHYGVYELRELDGSYNGNFAGENGGLRPENTYFLNIPV